MLDQNTFRETLHLVQSVAASSDQPMSREEALSYFHDMELSPEQQELVYRFLLQAKESADDADTAEPADHVDAVGPADDADAVGPVADADAVDTAEAPRKPLKDACSTAHFSTYMREVKKISKLEQSQDQRLYQRLRAGDQAVIGEISHQWLQRIVTMAREYQRDGFCLDDLVQEGNMALLTALHELLGCQEEQEMEKRLVEAVMDGIEQYMGLESGAQQQEETILAKVSLLHEARELLKARSGEEPSVKQLMDYTRLTVQEIHDIMDLMEKANR